MPDTVATAMAAMIFDEALGSEVTAPTRRLLTASVRRAVESSTPGLRLADWAAGPGPDGEQFACTVDLVRAELAADPLLAARCATTVATGDQAERALSALAGRLEAAGHDGAAGACFRALDALVPGRSRPSMTAVADRSRPA